MTKRIVARRSSQFDLDSLHIKEAIEKLSEFTPDARIEFIFAYEGDTNCCAVWYEEETDVEYAARLQHEQRCAIMAEQRERAEYEKLKAKFEGQPSQ